MDKEKWLSYKWKKQSQQGLVVGKSQIVNMMKTFLHIKKQKIKM